MIRRKLTLIFIGVLLFLIIGSMPAFTQNRQTLADNVSLGGYGAPVFMTTSFFNFSQWDVLVGARGGISINNFTIGGSVASTEGRSVKIDTDSSSDEKGLSMVYGGLFLEYTLNSQELIHVSFPLELVSGAMRIRDRDRIFGDEDYNVFFGAIPGVNLDINVVSFFVIGIHAGYRFVALYDDVDEYDGAIDSGIDLWGLQTGLVLRFGKFN